MSTNPKTRPQTPEERAAEKAAWENRQRMLYQDFPNNAGKPGYLAASVKLGPAPTAWQSIPTGVRFAIWLWAIATLCGAIAAGIWGVVLLLILGAQ